MRRYALRDDQWDRVQDFLPGRVTDRLHRLMVELEEKVGSLETALASPPPPPVPLPDNLAALYRERIDDLAATLEDSDHRIEARDRLRPLIERVTIRFRAAGTGIEIGLEGAIWRRCSTSG
ncbi:hypothetical protein CRT60_11935 [Azospirillum palustre]|uniref:Uncharacterized protein n=1 Tax=Azospirillum palustre TaxID=2044885 RepID=A0A2B8BHH8_9PROT|nr:hypothetical protein [Azospirillum palustre]PGH57179.1 hypothetical protein CRT60_11935 [Azospirillum palustre]